MLKKIAAMFVISFMSLTISANQNISSTMNATSGKSSDNSIKISRKKILIPIDKLMAVVGNEVITKTQLANQINVIKVQLKKSNVTLPAEDILQKQVLRQLIDKSLQLQVAKRIGMSISSKDIKLAITQIAKQNNQTVKTLYESVRKQGLSQNDFNQEIRDELTIQKLQSIEVASHISVSEREVDDFIHVAQNISNEKIMSEYHMKDIVISLPSEPSSDQIDAAKKHAEELIRKLKRGSNFTEVAAAESSGSQALQGGDLGWRKLAELPLVFAKLIQSMKIGKLAGPIKTSNGFHIIKLVGKRRQTKGSTYQQAEISIIMLPITSREQKTTVIKRLNRIYKQILHGSDFGMLAKKYSQDIKTAQKNGYVGWVKPGKFGPIIDNVITKLKSGELSQVIVTNKAAYLLKVLAKRQTTISTDTQRNQIKQLIFQRKLQEAIQVFINTLHNQIYVKIF